MAISFMRTLLLKVHRETYGWLNAAALPQGTLAKTLHCKRGLTGTQLGCDRGGCGAYTVMLADRALRPPSV
jgi:aerobic-type carbon monoxide dehydrogenase small subunit (CoxS/CutS family)